MITQQTAANITTGSTLGNMYAVSLPMANPSPSPNDYAAAAVVINQLSANQTAIWLHMQNLSLHDSACPCMLQIQQLCTVCPAQQRCINSLKCQHLVMHPPSKR
jgi:hypothetical protein